jgi:uncharacterized protein
MGFYKKSSELNIQKSGDRWALYHKRLGGLCLVDKKSLKVLDEFDSRLFLSDDLLEKENLSKKEKLIIQYLLREFILPIEMEQYSSTNLKKGINIIQLVVTNSCNFSCSYCFEGTKDSVSEKINFLAPDGINKENDISINIENPIYSTKERIFAQYDKTNRLMHPDDALNYIQKSIALAKLYNNDSIMIQFFGGEPLLNWKAISGVLENFGDGAKYGINIRYTIVTNGSIITDEIADALHRYNVGVCVSFDPPKNNNRCLKNGQDSSLLVIDGVNKLNKYQNRIALNVTLSLHTWEYCNESIIDFAYQNGIKEIGVVLDLDPCFYHDIGQEKIVDRLWKLLTIGKKKNIVVTGYWHQIFQLMAGFNAVSPRGFKMCSAKGRQFSIEPNGSVFSCKGASGYFGHISEGNSLFFSENYIKHERLSVKNPSMCSGCEIEGFCSGFCLGPLEKKFNTIESVETLACGVYTGITRKLIENIDPKDVETFNFDTL